MAIPCWLSSQNSSTESQSSTNIDVKQVTPDDFPTHLRDGNFPKILQMPDSSYIFMLNALQINDWIRKDELINVQAKKIDNLLNTGLITEKLIENQDVMMGIQLESNGVLKGISNETKETYKLTKEYVTNGESELNNLKAEVRIVSGQLEGCSKVANFYRQERNIWRILGVGSAAALIATLLEWY